jgi:hypothetical protein
MMKSVLKKRKPKLSMVAVLKDEVQTTLIDLPTSPARKKVTLTMFSFAATEWRKIVAHGMSRGLGVLRFVSPGGATENPRPFIRFLSPLTGLWLFSHFSHGCHRGLFSIAVPRLNLI